MKRASGRAGALVRRASRAGLPIVVAAALATALLGYYGFLGARYWTASRQVAAATVEIERLTRLVEASTAAAGAESQGQDSAKRLEELQAVFQARGSDDLFSLLATTAQEAGVSLKSVTGGEPAPSTLEGIQWLAEPMSVTLQGSTGDTYRFLSLLQGKAPAMAVGEVRLSGVQVLPSAQVQLVFYSLPAGDAAPGAQ